MSKVLFLIIVFLNVLSGIIFTNSLQKACDSFYSKTKKRTDFFDENWSDLKPLLDYKLMDQETNQAFEEIKKMIGCNHCIKLIGVNIPLPNVVHLNLNKSIIYLDKSRYSQMTSSAKIRLLLTAASLTLHDLSNEDFLSEYYKMADKIECPTCLEQWRNTLHFCHERQDHNKNSCCLNSLEKFLKLTKKDAYNGYCSAHTNTPASCIFWETAALWTGVSCAVQRFEQCLNRKLQDYVPMS